MCKQDMLNISTEDKTFYLFKIEEFPDIEIRFD